MLTEDGKHLYVSYDEYHSLIEKLALQVHQSGWEFDTILCLARGGLRPGDILSRIFDKPLAIMSTSSYRAESGTVQGHLDIARFITTPKGEIAGRVLLVDDLADSGHTLNTVNTGFEFHDSVNAVAFYLQNEFFITFRSFAGISYFVFPAFCFKIHCVRSVHIFYKNCCFVATGSCPNF